MINPKPCHPKPFRDTEMNFRMLPSNLHNVRGRNKFLQLSPGALCGTYRGSLVFQHTETSMSPFHIHTKVCGSIVGTSNSSDNFDRLIKSKLTYQISNYELLFKVQNWR